MLFSSSSSTSSLTKMAPTTTTITVFAIIKMWCTSLLTLLPLLTIIITFITTTPNSVEAQQNPTISFITPERIVGIGDTLDISCSVQYAKNYPVIWAKIDPHNPQNILFISKGASQSIPDHRYSIRHDDASSTYTLQISKIQEIDAGIYQCQVVLSTSSRVTANVNVYVRVPPVISDNSTRSMITSTGETIQLECYATGYPQPSISWRRENNDLMPTGGSLYRGNILVINNITKSDRGTYYCIADNNVGSGARRNVVVEVEFAPQVTIDRARYEQAIGYDADLQCHVEAYPAPIIRWLKDGVEISDSANYQISLFPTSHDYTDSVIRVKRIERRHYGVYTCKAQNKLGAHQKLIELEESPNPICPPACGGSSSSSGGNYASFASSSIKPTLDTTMMVVVVVFVFVTTTILALSASA